MMRKLAWAVVVTIVFSNTANAVVIWSLSEGGNGHAYEWVQPGIISWQTAKVQAGSLTPPSDQGSGFNNGHLVTFIDELEFDFVAGTFTPFINSGSGHDGAWFGFTDEVTEGEWRSWQRKSAK